MTLMMEATKTIISQEVAAGAKVPDQFDRTPFSHKQLDSIDNLNAQGPNSLIGKDQLYKLAKSVGMLNVLRWKPRRVCLNIFVEIIVNDLLTRRFL